MMSLAVAINNVKDNFIPAMINIFTFSRCYHTELILSNGTAIYCGPKGVKYIKRDNYDMYSWILIPLNEIDAEAEDHIKEEVNRYIEQNRGDISTDAFINVYATLVNKQKLYNTYG